MRTVGILSVLLALTGCGSSVEGTRNGEGLGGEGSSETGGRSSRENTGGEEASSGGSPDNTGGDESTGGNEPQGSGGRENNTGGTESTGGSDNTGGVVETGGTGGIVTTGGTGGSDNTGGTGGTSMECEPGDQKCTDLDIEICSEEGQWEVSQTCPFVCNLDQMFGAQCIGTCEPDTKQCSVEGYTEVCNEYGQWMVTEVCPNACVDGECVGSCEPSEIQCAGDNVQFCNSNGAWDVVDTCEFVCSGGDCIGVCEPGSVDCLGDTPRTCNAQGQWVLGNECPFMCSAGSCTGSCEPGAKKCSGSGTQTCSAQGTWSSVSACPAGPHETASCSGAGICGKSCDSGFADCTGAAGCESDLTAVSTCGTCNTNCNSNPANAAPICTAQGCGMVCDEGWGDLNDNAADGCEHDVSTDSENCGSIGNSCYGGSCTAGVCEFEGIEEVVFINNRYINTMAVYGSHVYGVTTLGEVFRVGKDGSNYTELATGYPLKARFAFEVEEDEIVLVSDCTNHTGCTSGKDGIYRMDLDGSNSARISTHEPFMFDIEAGYVYWNDGFIDRRAVETKYHKFYRVSTSGGSVTTLGTMSTTKGVQAQVEVVGSKIYFAQIQNDCTVGSLCHTYSIYEYNISPWSASRTIAQATEESGEYYEISDSGENYLPVAFKVQGDYLYWSANTVWWDAPFNRHLSTGHRIGRASLVMADAIHNDLISQEDAYGTIAVDANHIYFGSSVLKRVGINGGSATTLSPAHNILGIDLDSSYVYWISNTSIDGNYNVFRQAK